MNKHYRDSVRQVRCPSAIEDMLEYLHLRDTAHQYKDLLAQSAKDNLSHEEFLRRFLSQETSAKFERQVGLRIAHAKFPVIKTLNQFDFAHPASIPKQKILHAAELSFLDTADGLVFMGPTGVGKTHLAIAIGYAAASRGVRTLYVRAVDMINHLIASQADHSLHKVMQVYAGPCLLIIDEVGYLPFDQQGADHFFNVISRRYEKGSVILTTNRPFKDWGRIFHDITVASAIIDRLAHHSEVIKIEGASYRVKDKKMKIQTAIQE
jgi:DNA replication protein DnaC